MESFSLFLQPFHLSLRAHETYATLLASTER